jgi:hypothetical protein
MGARSGSGTLMYVARTRANHWLNAVPANDRVMLLRADALATPATAFESDHSRVRAAIAASEPGATSLDIEQALNFARHAQGLQGGRGEIAFVGSGRITDHNGDRKDGTPIDGNGLRVMLIPDAIENAGLRRVSVKRSATDPFQWDALVAVRNYGAKPRAITLTVGFDHAPVGIRRLLVAPGGEQEAAFSWKTQRAGLLEAELNPEDAFPADDRASLIVPALPVLPVVVYTDRPDIVRPFLAANPRVRAEFRSLSQYRPDDKGLVVLDHFRPSARPQGSTIWLDPPAGDSPFAVVKTVDKPHGLHWIANSVLSAGLRAHDSRIPSALVFRPVDGDIRVAEVDDGPVILARPGAKKMVVIGFDPGVPAMRFELSTPLLFADILRWIDPDAFRQPDLSVQAAGTVSTALDGDESTGPLTVTREDGSPVPFTSDKGTLHFFSGARENVHVTGQDRDSTYSLTLPEMWDVKWQPPAGARVGVPRFRALNEAAPEMWPWLAVAGAGCLIAEWVLFARVRRARIRAMSPRPALRRAS